MKYFVGFLWGTILMQIGIMLLIEYQCHSSQQFALVNNYFCIDVNTSPLTIETPSWGVQVGPGSHRDAH